VTTGQGRSIDWIAVGLWGLGVCFLLWVSRLDFLRQDANWDLLNYHAYVPASLLNGTWFKDFHPAVTPSYLSPYQDLLTWPLIGGLPAPLATAVLVSAQVSILVPVGLIVRVLVPSLALWRALGIGLISVAGAMTTTELGTTMGDIPPAILTTWALYLLLSLTSPQGCSHPSRRAIIAGLLSGLAVALKLTIVLAIPGLFVVALFVMAAGRRRSALVFLGAAPAAAVILYAPWALVLQRTMDSPVFPFWNTIFHAPRFPLWDWRDLRFLVTSIGELAALPIRQLAGPTATSELAFTDARWVVAVVVALVALIAVSMRFVLRRRRSEATTKPGFLPGLALMLFWLVSYAVWAVLFGIQRYAIVLEVLAIPVIVAGSCSLAPRLESRHVGLTALAAMALLLAGTTTVVDFGRRPMGWAPIVPAQSIPALEPFGAIVAATPPIAYLRAVTRDTGSAQNQVWLYVPFNAADRLVADTVLRGQSVGVVFYQNAAAGANQAAMELGLRITGSCQQFQPPLERAGTGQITVCSAVPLTTFWR